MSLFQVRDYWETRCGNDEEFDVGCMCAANVDNDALGQVKIVCGSFQGLLRIFLPHHQDYSPEDLLFEKQLNFPILQLAVGRFIPDAPGQVALAVLHPRSLVVYSAVTSSGGIFTLTHIYQHQLGRTAFNMVYGPFGGAYGKDFFCVQSVDGMLSFYEHEVPTFHRFLSKFLTPGPLCYDLRTDTILTANSAMEVECYKYQVLTIASGSDRKQSENDASPSGVGKKLQVDWMLNVGSHVLDIKVAKFSKSLSLSQNDIVVQCERSLFVVKENGTINYQKSLDFFPSCMTFYSVQQDGLGKGQENLILCSNTGMLFVLQDMEVLWSARLPFTPVSCTVSTFGKLPGLIATLGDGGELLVGYLGTDPALNPPALVESKELDYEEVEKEQRRLQTVIRKAVTGKGRDLSKGNVSIRVQVPSTVEDSEDKYVDDEEEYTTKTVVVKVFLSYSGSGIIRDVVLTFSTQSPIVPLEESVCISSISGEMSSTPVVIPIGFRCKRSGIPSSLGIEVVAAYTTPSGAPRTVSCAVDLPLLLVCDVVGPVKNTKYKATLETNRAPVNLTALFEDLIVNESSKMNVSSNVISVKYISGMDCTILVSKSAGRYRIQSGNFEGLWLLCYETVKRLTHYFGSANMLSQEDQTEPFVITFVEGLPFNELFQCIDAHFGHRIIIKKSLEDLEKVTHQFRSVQKRLLVRFRDKNPSPLNKMDELLEITSQKIHEFSLRVEKEQESLQFSSQCLSCAVSLMLLLVRLRFRMSEEEFQILQSSLSPIVVDGSGQGWEETTDAAMTQLLRTSLAKNARESASVAAAIGLPSDSSKVKKHVALVLDRIGKGGRLLSKSDAKS